MPLDAKRKEWKGRGEEGKQIAQEEDGKEKPNGKKTKKTTQASITVSLL